MNNHVIGSIRNSTAQRAPLWAGFIIAIVLQAITVSALWVVEPRYAIGVFPVPQILMVITLAYFFGEGPCILAFCIGPVSLLLLQNHAFEVAPSSIALLGTNPALYTSILGSLFSGITGLWMRNSQTRIRSLIADLSKSERRASNMLDSLNHEHRIAEAFQLSLMHPIPNEMHCFEFDTIYRAAWDEARVGGDFYDVFSIGEDWVVIVVGDVSGKGLQAAVQVATIKYTIRGRQDECCEPARAMQSINKYVAAEIGAGSFITVFLGVLNSRTKTLSYANAGHEPAFMWNAREGRCEIFDSTGPAIGIDRESVYTHNTINLSTDDELILGTDGLTEVRSGATFLELGGLLALYTQAKHTRPCTAQDLLGRVIDYCDGDIRDDIALLKVSVRR